LYVSHTLSTWNARTFEFGAVIFLAAIFPGTLFFASCYALFRAAAAAILGSWIGNLVDNQNRLYVVRHSIVWQRLSVAGSCLVLAAMLMLGGNGLVTYSLFFISVILACIEKLAFVANTVAVERDWIIVVSDSLGAERQQLNSTMRRIDLVCKLIAPVGIGLLDSYSTKVAVWVVFAQNAISVAVEYFAIAQVYAAIPELAHGKGQTVSETSQQDVAPSPPNSNMLQTITESLQPWRDYFYNPAFLASFSLSLLYLTVLSFASQMTTYLLTLGFTSAHVSAMRLVSVVLELSATIVAPWLMKRIGAIRAGLWFINEQLLSIALALGLFFYYRDEKMIAGGVLVAGVALSRLGLWGFDLSVQYLVQEDAPEATRGSFSAIEMSLQNLFELLSFATTMIFYRPEDFRIPIYISVGATATSAACFTGFVRQKRGHLLHTNKCLKRTGKGRTNYQVLPTIEEEIELDERVEREA
jgi:iron-regulated transporter 1